VRHRCRRCGTIAGVATSQLRLLPLLGFDPAVGLWLAALEDCRARTKGARVANLTPAALDWSCSDLPSNAGTLLAHIAAIENDWLFTEILEEPIPAEIALLPPDVCDAVGRLLPVMGLPLAEHFRRLDATRATLLARLHDMDATDLRTPRHLERYDVTPEWVFHHLLQHEAHHRGQIFALCARTEGLA
jgi:uncharacterized damage-inducible protein DinB